MHSLGLSLIFIVTVFRNFEPIQCQLPDGTSRSAMGKQVATKRISLKDVCRCSEPDQSCACCVKYNKTPFEANGCITFHLKDVLIKGNSQFCIDFYTGSACGILTLNVTETKLCHKGIIQFGQLVVFADESCYDFSKLGGKSSGKGRKPVPPKGPKIKGPKRKIPERKVTKSKAIKNKVPKRKVPKRKSPTTKVPKRVGSTKKESKRKSYKVKSSKTSKTQSF